MKINKERDMFIYRVWDNETESWAKNFRNSKSYWSKRGNALRILSGRDNAEIVKFKLVKVEDG